MQSNKKEINEFLGKNHLELFLKKEHVTKQGTKSSEKNLFQLQKNNMNDSRTNFNWSHLNLLECRLLQ